LIKDRESKIRQKPKKVIKTPKSPEPIKFTASDKILIQKFNKEFDQIRDEMLKVQKGLMTPRSARESPTKDMEANDQEGFRSHRDMSPVMES
jgi:hypothetical protein